MNLVEQNESYLAQPDILHSTLFCICTTALTESFRHKTKESVGPPGPSPFEGHVTECPQRSTNGEAHAANNYQTCQPPPAPPPLLGNW